jgi:hypothetical protein
MEANDPEQSHVLHPGATSQRALVVQLNEHLPGRALCSWAARQISRQRRGAGPSGSRTWQTSCVALPTPPSGQALQLLETTWQMASANLRWPVFAELDRRLYSSYDIQALDVIRAIPPGFLYGVGPNSPLPPAETQEIGLTVAGVAACPNSSEILSVFVEFIQMAAITEKVWLPPSDDPACPPTLTDADFAARARTLPAAGREHLLRLLFLIIQAERSGWAGLSSNPQTGQWAVSLSRQIRDFATISDIDDYWSRRYKPWESGASFPRPVAPTTPVNPPAAGSSARGDETVGRPAPAIVGTRSKRASEIADSPDRENPQPSAGMV